jgi:type I restriction enzyme S subunit
MPLLVPKLNILEAFNSQYDTIETKKTKLWLENRELTSLRDSLLPMLMNGQVTVE